MQDCYDAPLTFSGGEYDTMMMALLRGVYSGHNDSQLVLSMEQSVPVLKGWLNFNRCPCKLWCCVSAWTIMTPVKHKLLQC